MNWDIARQVEESNHGNPNSAGMMVKISLKQKLPV